jgi:hypothetical protein
MAQTPFLAIIPRDGHMVEVPCPGIVYPVSEGGVIHGDVVVPVLVDTNSPKPKISVEYADDKFIIRADWTASEMADRDDVQPVVGTINHF